MFSRKAQEDSNAGTVTPFMSLWGSALKLWVQVVDGTSKSVKGFDVREGITCQEISAWVSVCLLLEEWKLV